ncbi:MAG: thioredoxin family protein [Gammaproteobacteria bacterium]|nr:thioredoxin family protein [Gammaproteobacteria bacterium]
MRKLLLATCSILFFMSACSIAQEATHSKKSSDYPTGSMTKTELKSYSEFFKHHDSEVSQEDVDLLKTIDEPIVLTTYFGLWCHDSQREIPQLLDLLEAAENDNLILRLIALDINKKEPFNRQDEDQVLYTPTIIVSRDGTEIGRIIEKPDNSLAQDIVDFIEN